MELDDRVTVATPEGLDVDLVVAGLGSRFISSLVDTSLQVALIIPLGLLAVVAGSAGAAAGAVGTLLVLFGLPTAFDAFGGGRTPGRRLAGLRLVREDGAPVDLVPAVVRNVVRVIDLLPAAYSVGCIAVLVTPRNQRVGDLAAGTLVVRDAPRRSATAAAPGAERASDPAVALPPEAVSWDLARVTVGDVAVLRSFASRATTLEPDARRRLAAELAGRLEPVVVGPTRARGDEAFLAAVLAAKEARGR